MNNKTTKDIVFLIIDAITNLLVILSTCWLTVASIQYGYNMKEENTTRVAKRSLNHIDTPEEIPEVSYNTYYLLTWHSTNASFIAPSNSGVKYILNDAWTFATLPDDTLFISTHDNDILTKQQFETTYEERDIRINRSSNRKLLVPYMGTYIEETATEENYNILISMNEFQYNTNYRFLDITNGLGSYNIATYWSTMNSDETLDNEFIIKWGQPMLLLESETFTHSVDTTLTIQAFIQPISVKFSNETAMDIAFQNGYDSGYDSGYDDGQDVGYENGVRSGLGFFSILESATNSIHNVMSIEIIPGLTLATMLGVFVGLPLFFFFLKMISAR